MKLSIIIILHFQLFNEQNVSSFLPLSSIIHFLNFFLHLKFSLIKRFLMYLFHFLITKLLFYGNSFHRLSLLSPPFEIITFTSKDINFPLREAGFDPNDDYVLLNYLDYVPYYYISY